SLYKVHLQITKEEWKDVYKALMAAFDHDNELINTIISQKKAQGKDQFASVNELKEAGGKCAHLQHWKIINYEKLTESMPGLVFYAHRTSQDSSRQNVQDM